MDALKLRCMTVAFVLFAATGETEAASYQTVNFSVTAKRADVAEQVGKAAEVYRQKLAIFWLGKPLPNWSRPCKVAVDEGALGAGGQTTFQFVRGEVLNWRMHVQGSLERILDSVLPHEINHTIFACHFRRPLPRWADEGAATLFEHRSEQLKQLALLNEVIRSKNEIISLRDLLSMKEYPQGQRPMLTLYAQGYALADFLVQQKGRQAYLRFIADGERGGWEKAIRSNFDHEGIESLERNWRGWVLAGMPKLTLPREQMLAAEENTAESLALAAARPEMPASPRSQPAANRTSQTSGGSVIRSQSPDPTSLLKNEASGSPSRTETRAGSAIAMASEARTAMPTGAAASAEHRRSSLEAPAPRPRDTKTTQRSAGSSAVESENTEASSGLNGANSETEPEAIPLTGTRFQAADLEPTGLITSELSETNGGAANRNGESFDFSDGPLLRERSVRSGSTPKWAGFPGQKKLF